MRYWINTVSRDHVERGKDGHCSQSFTAMAVVTDDKAYQEPVTPDFHPWRRHVEYLPATDAPIRPLIDDLEFIRNKKSWGFTFRRGFFEINEADFRKIAGAMGVAAPS